MVINNQKLVCKFCKDYEDFKEIDEFSRDSEIKSKNADFDNKKSIFT